MTLACNWINVNLFRMFEQIIAELRRDKFVLGSMKYLNRDVYVRKTESPVFVNCLGVVGWAIGALTKQFLEIAHEQILKIGQFKKFPVGRTQARIKHFGEGFRAFHNGLHESEQRKRNLEYS